MSATLDASKTAVTARAAKARLISPSETSGDSMRRRVEASAEILDQLTAE
jgi:hypothetical protein